MASELWSLGYIRGLGRGYTFKRPLLKAVLMAGGSDRSKTEREPSSCCDFEISDLENNTGHLQVLNPTNQKAKMLCTKAFCLSMLAWSPWVIRNSMQESKQASQGRKPSLLGFQAATEKVKCLSSSATQKCSRENKELSLLVRRPALPQPFLFF